MDDLLTRYILTIPLLILFQILVSAVNRVWLSNDDYHDLLNNVADQLIDKGYTTEEAIRLVFARLNLFRDEPEYGACGFRCDGRCQTCIRLGGSGEGVSLNASGYYD